MSGIEHNVARTSQPTMYRVPSSTVISLTKPHALHTRLMLSIQRCCFVWAFAKGNSRIQRFAWVIVRYCWTFLVSLINIKLWWGKMVERERWHTGVRVCVFSCIWFTAQVFRWNLRRECRAWIVFAVVHQTMRNVSGFQTIKNKSSKTTIEQIS